MKTWIILLLLTPFTVCAQSKKELQAQLLKQTATNDSLELVLKKQVVAADSLKAELALQLKKFGYQLTYTETLEHNVENIRKKFNDCTEENSRLTEELNKYTSKEKPVTSTKPKTPQTNPFGGSVNGNGKGDGNAQNDSPFGNDGGISKGTGPGLGTDNSRVQIKTPSTDQIHSTENCTISYKVVIAPDGKVVGLPTVIPSRTTTTNKELIDSVAKLLSSDLLYNKISGTENTIKTFTIKINAH